jgi:hypothetical protein
LSSARMAPDRASRGPTSIACGWTSPDRPSPRCPARTVRVNCDRNPAQGTLEIHHANGNTGRGGQARDSVVNARSREELVSSHDADRIMRPARRPLEGCGPRHPLRFGRARAGTRVSRGCPHRGQYRAAEGGLACLSPDDLPVSTCGRAADNGTVRSLYLIAQHGPRVAALRARAIVTPWGLSLTRGLWRGGVISPLAGSTGASGRRRSATCTSSARTVRSP